MDRTPDVLRQEEDKDLLRFLTAGSVDDGKSTLVGRLLYEAHGIYEDQLSGLSGNLRKGVEREDEIDLSLLTDGLKAEREQGITIDVAYRYFSTPRRKFIIADSPGHEAYTRNMATAASTASLAIILVDAERGVTTQGRRHTFISALLGIPHIVVAVNKMDRVDYDEQRFEEIREEFASFVTKLETRDLHFIPVSALVGDNVVTRGDRMPWYQGTTLLNHLETVHVGSDRNLIDLRFPVQSAVRPHADFRGYAGTVASGVMRPGDKVRVLPTGTRSTVKRLHGVDGVIEEAYPPLPVIVELADEVDVSRGDMIVHEHNLPRVDNAFEAMIIWMDNEPLTPGRNYLIKHATRTVPGTVTDLRYRIDVNTFHSHDAEQLQLNEIGRTVVTLHRSVPFDPYSKNRETGAFLVIDRTSNRTVGAGMILDREPATLMRSSGLWQGEPLTTGLEVREGLVSNASRAERMEQKPVTVWITGLPGSGKTSLAQALDKRLYDLGHHAFVLDGESIRAGLSRDLSVSAKDRTENVRRIATVAGLMNDAGLVVICALLAPYAGDRERARKALGTERFLEVFVTAPDAVRRERKPELYARADRGELNNFPGVNGPYDVPERPEVTLDTSVLSLEDSVDRIMDRLTERGCFS